MVKKTLIITALAAALIVPSVTLAKAENSSRSSLPGDDQKSQAAVQATTRANEVKSSTTQTTDTVTTTATPASETVADLTAGAKDWKAKVTEFKQATQAQRAAKLQALGATLIENRVSLLTQLKARIQNMKNVEAATKTQLIAEIDSKIAGLNQLKSQIQNEKDVTKLKTLIKSIFQDYKVYVVAAPKGLGQALVAKGQYILGQLEALQRKVQTVLAQKKNEGKSTAEIDALMTQFNAKLTDAKAQLAIADTKFKAMNPANTEEAKTARTAGKEAMTQAKQDLKDAAALLKSMIAKLKTLDGTPKTPVEDTNDTNLDTTTTPATTTTTPTSSATPTTDTATEND